MPSGGRLRLGSVAIITSIAGVGCIEPFHGSNVQFDFSPAMPVQASAGAMPGVGEIPHDAHFTFYAFTTGTDASGNAVGRLFAVQRFEIHRIVDVTSPCFIDVGSHVPYPGLHVSQFATFIEAATGISDPANPPPGATQAQKIEVATAIQREANVALLGGDGGIKVVSSASTSSYPPVGADCLDNAGIPPPTCTDPSSNMRRLAMCQAAWKADKNYFEGTDRVLTQPLNGTTHGMVDGLDPINMAPVGGAQFFPDTDLGGVDGYALYWQTNDQPDPGTLLAYGMATMPTLGVIHVHMTSPSSPSLTADVAIFPNIDQTPSSF